MTNRELIEAGYSGDISAAMTLVSHAFFKYDMHVEINEKYCHVKMTFWPCLENDPAKHYTFDNYGETVAECVVLCYQDVINYGKTGTNYQIKEMG